MIYAMTQNEQINNVNYLIDCAMLLHDLIKNNLSVGSQLNFSTLVAKLSRADQNRCVIASRAYRDSELIVMANYIEYESDCSSFKCGNEVINDFIIQRIN